MSSSWALALTNQLAGSLVQLGAQELLNRPAVTLEDLDAAFLVSPDGAQESSVGETAMVAAFVAALAAVAVWAFSWLGAMCWWLVTGRGPGGRILAASAVTPRHYELRGRMQ